MGQLFCIFISVRSPKHTRHHHGRRGIPFVPLRSSKKDPVPTPTNYNIVHIASGFCLWVDTSRSAIMDGAVDMQQRSAKFSINLYDPGDLTTFWIQSLAFSSVTAVAADFSAQPAQIVMVTSLIFIARFVDY